MEGASGTSVAEASCGERFVSGHEFTRADKRREKAGLQRPANCVQRLKPISQQASYGTTKVVP